MQWRDIVWSKNQHTMPSLLEHRMLAKQTKVAQQESLEEQNEEINASAFVTHSGDKLKVCFNCAARAVFPPLDDLYENRLRNSFHSTDKATRYFKNLYPSKLNLHILIHCPLCFPAAVLFDMEHF